MRRALSVIPTVDVMSTNTFIVGEKLIFLKIDFENRCALSNNDARLVSLDGAHFCMMERWPFSTKW